MGSSVSEVVHTFTAMIFLPQDDQGPSVTSLRLAADNGDAVAQYNLGRRYELGLGVEQDDREAARLYHLAADQGNAEAQYSLGHMPENGRGEPCAGPFLSFLSYL